MKDKESLAYFSKNTLFFLETCFVKGLLKRLRQLLVLQVFTGFTSYRFSAFYSMIHQTSHFKAKFKNRNHHRSPGYTKNSSQTVSKALFNVYCFLLDTYL